MRPSRNGRRKASTPRLKLLDHLPKKYTCIIFDRRECGQSGGRVERVTWAHYVAQGKGLLDHLEIERAHIMGGCMGCCPVPAFAVAYPQATLSMISILAGGRRQISAQQPSAFCRTSRLRAAARAGEASWRWSPRTASRSARDPRGGPWASVIKHDRAFAEAYAKQNVDDYKLIVAGMARTLFDRDTAPGAEPEDLLRARHSRP